MERAALAWRLPSAGCSTAREAAPLRWRSGRQTASRSAGRSTCARRGRTRLVAEAPAVVERRHVDESDVRVAPDGLGEAAAHVGDRDEARGALLELDADAR